MEGKDKEGNGTRPDSEEFCVELKSIKPTMETSSFFFRAKPKKVLSSVKRALQDSAPPSKSPQKGTEEIKEADKRAKIDPPNEVVLVDEIKSNDKDEEKVLPMSKKEEIIIVSDERTAPVELSPEVAQKYAKLLRPTTKTPVTPLYIGSDDTASDVQLHPRLQSSLQNSKISSRIRSVTPNPANNVKIEVTILNHLPYPSGRSFQYHMYPDDLFEKVFYPFACLVNESMNRLYFTLPDGLRLFGSSSPASLGLPYRPFSINANTKEGYDKLKKSYNEKREELLKTQEIRPLNDYVPSEATNTHEEETVEIAPSISTIKLKFKSGKKAEPVILSVDPSQPFATIVDTLKESLSVTTALTLLFDGDPIKETDTPDALGLEDEDLIEVRIL